MNQVHVLFFSKYPNIQVIQVTDLKAGEYVIDQVIGVEISVIGRKYKVSKVIRTRRFYRTFPRISSGFYLLVGFLISLG